ncbi:hypothetical protein NOR_08060 [Metarhizium rileyi]|uniref:Uncharacterized protein n=1 Tax=Metarhizium rileyi (strain RCEF 4871) TaxID=1649241 RepID=A0A166RZN7_METRR|nr:hypothetical protein NOR_08060 [Metarhizium rileyi RCEF 4871]
MAVAYGADTPPEIELASLLRNAKEIQGHMAVMQRTLVHEIPYGDGALTDSDLDLGRDLIKKERQCIYLRNAMKPETAQGRLDFVPHADYPDQITGDQDVTLEITSSVAKIASKNLGWSTVTAKGSPESSTFDFFARSVKDIDTTFLHRKKDYKGAAASQVSEKTEFRTDMKLSRVCPAKSVCRVVTWTYTRTVQGSCFLMPYLNTRCVGDVNELKYSAGLFADCSPIKSIAYNFFDISDADLGAGLEPAFGPDWQGIKMADPKVVKGFKYHQNNCTFTYVLRLDNGEPVRAQALIIEPWGSTPSKGVAASENTLPQVDIIFDGMSDFVAQRQAKNRSVDDLGPVKRRRGVSHIPPKKPPKEDLSKPIHTAGAKVSIRTCLRKIGLL